MELPVRKIQIIRRAIRAFNAPNSAPQGEDGESMDFAEICADKRTPAPEESVAQREEFTVLLRLLDSIDERDARILRLRFGLEGKEPLTLKEIGEEVGLTRERVRQIQAEALRRLQTQLEDDRPSRFVGQNQPRRRRQANGTKGPLDHGQGDIRRAS